MFSQLYTVLSQDEICADPSAYLLDRRRRYLSENVTVVQPKSVQSVRNLMRLCSQHGIAVTPQGGNTGLVGGSTAQGGIIVNLSRLNAIRDINIADNTITVEAGCILQNVQAAASEAGRFFPLSLASEGSCQIGGNIACNAGGLNVLRYGTMRDLVLGLEVVLPNGELISHLQPLHKNTSGYELKHLFIGSEGTLGIITAATLKLFAPAQTVETAWIGVESVEQAVGLLSAIRNRFAERVCSFELVSRFALSLSLEYSNLTPPLDASWHILLELTDSLPDENLSSCLADFLYEQGFHNAVIAQTGQERHELWTLRENISAAQSRLGVSIKHDIALPIARVAEFVTSCGTVLRQRYSDIRIVVFGHLGDGSLHYNTFLPDVCDNGVYAYEEAINEIVYRHVLQQGGTIAAEHGIGCLKRNLLPLVRNSEELALMSAVKKQLDPNGIMNPGKLLPELI